VRNKASGPDQGGRGTVSPRQPSYTFYIVPNEAGVTAQNARVSDYQDSTSTSPFNLPWQRLAGTAMYQLPFDERSPFLFRVLHSRSISEHKGRTHLYIVSLQR